MRISTFWYCLKQGIINICRNIWFSLASIATISACIFLFCLFFAIVANVKHGAEVAETTVGITVFFDESMTEEHIRAVGSQISGWSEVREADFISAEEAWENFKSEYFEGMEELAEGFEEDNPLAGSASYEIFLKDIADQQKIVKRLQGMEGVRRVRYSSALAAGFTSLGKMIGALSALIIGVLLAVAVFLISNTISVAAAFRRRENEIMRYIGATNAMIRAPFVVEGVLLGFWGAVVPLAGIYVLYQKGIEYINEEYGIITGMIKPLDLWKLFPSMAAVAMALGVGIGFVVSLVTIQRHLRA
ncbi:MAG: permease-like cell division protein FtsX [Enterocloster sp.]